MRSDRRVPQNGHDPPIYANLTFWCRVDGIAPVSCSQGLPSNRLKVAGISIPWNSTSLTPWFDGRISAALIPNLLRVLRGHIFKGDPLSSSTNGIHLVRHFKEMYKGLLCARPLGGKSLSVKAIVGFGTLDAIIRLTKALGVISMGTLVFPKVLNEE